jgi:hypothetical protein
MNDDLNGWRTSQPRTMSGDEAAKLLDVVTACRVRLFGPGSVQMLRLKDSPALLPHRA